MNSADEAFRNAVSQDEIVHGRDADCPVNSQAISFDEKVVPDRTVIVSHDPAAARTCVQTSHERKGRPALRCGLAGGRRDMDQAARRG